MVEDRRAERGRPVVFDFRDLVHRGFRYGLINTLVLALGEFGAFFVLPIFLQAGLHLSAVELGHGCYRRGRWRSSAVASAAS